MTTLHLRTSIGRSLLRLAFLLIPILFGCFALAPTARAVSPAPDGGYPFANTAEGTGALQNLTSGVWNTANGYQTLFHDNTGGQNIATGVQALFTNTSGSSNLATGIQALYNNTTGSKNTATGFQALNSNKTGATNVAEGYRALLNNTVDNNTAIGAFALLSNTTGTPNTAVGTNALYHNLTGDFNDAVGASALFNNTNGFSNNALGESALFRNIHGAENTAVGDLALANNDSTGNGVANNNTAVGAGALSNNSDGNSNTALGFNAGMNPGIGSNNMYIGDAGFAGDNNVIAIGGVSATGTAYTDCFIGGIFGNPSPGSAVYIATDGHLSTTASSRRFKDEIKPMDKTSEAIFALKPVTFRYKKEIDANRIPQFGLVAEDVAKVNPDLVVNGRDGKPYTVRYEQINAMLLNEFLKEHKKVQDLETTVAQQQKGMEVLTAQLKEQAGQIQKVSAERELRKSAPKTVVND